MKTFSDRVKKRRLELGLSQERLGDLVGVSQGLIGQIENGRNRGSKHIAALARALQCSADWLDTGKGDMLRHRKQPIDLEQHPEYVGVKRVKFKLSAGISGFEIDYLNGARAPLFFRRDWLEARGLEEDKLFAVEITGRSMEPSLFEGDLVVVNAADVIPRDGEAFALNYEGELVVKRLIREGDAWYMRSDNADKIRFGDKRCDERTTIIGRIVTKQSERV